LIIKLKTQFGTVNAGNQALTPEFFGKEDGYGSILTQ